MFSIEYVMYKNPHKSKACDLGFAALVQHPVGVTAEGCSPALCTLNVHFTLNSVHRWFAQKLLMLVFRPGEMEYDSEILKSNSRYEACFPW